MCGVMANLVNVLQLSIGYFMISVVFTPEIPHEFYFLMNMSVESTSTIHLKIERVWYLMY
jgi:hypothetical protein